MKKEEEKEEKFNAFLSIYCLKEFSNNYNWNFSFFSQFPDLNLAFTLCKRSAVKTRISFSFSVIEFAAWKFRIMNIIIIQTELDMEMWLNSNEWKWYEYATHDA